MCDPKTIKIKTKDDFPEDDWRHHYSSLSALLLDMKDMRIDVTDVLKRINELDDDLHATHIDDVKSGGSFQLPKHGDRIRKG